MTLFIKFLIMAVITIIVFSVIVWWLLKIKNFTWFVYGLFTLLILLVAIGLMVFAWMKLGVIN